MSRKPVDLLIKMVADNVGGVRRCTPPTELRKLFEKRDYVALVGRIKASMHLNMHLTLAKVRSGGPERAPAWIEIPANIPLYGSREFKLVRATIFMRYEFLKTAPFETLVFAIAHEMAHVVLESIRHPLRRDERAVDIAAMILGFAEYYEKGILYEEEYIDVAYIRGPITFFKRISLWLQTVPLQRFPIRHERTVKVGYLSVTEAKEALLAIKKMR